MGRHLRLSGSTQVSALPSTARLPVSGLTLSEPFGPSLLEGLSMDSCYRTTPLIRILHRISVIRITSFIRIDFSGIPPRYPECLNRIVAIIRIPSTDLNYPYSRVPLQLSGLSCEEYVAIIRSALTVLPRLYEHFMALLHLSGFCVH